MCGIVNPPPPPLPRFYPPPALPPPLSPPSPPSPLPPPPTQEPAQKPSTLWEKRKERRWLKYLKEGKEAMLELLQKLHIEGEVVQKAILRDYEMWEEKMNGRYKHWKRKCQQKDIISVSLYKTLIHMDRPRALKEICSYSKASILKVWQLQKYDEIRDPNQKSDKIPVTPKDLIESKRAYLGLNFQDSKSMCQVLNQIRHLERDFSPHTISATVVYEYLQHKQSKGITKKGVSQIFMSRPAAVLRFQTHLEKHHVRLNFDSLSHVVSKPGK